MSVLPSGLVRRIRGVATSLRHGLRRVRAEDVCEVVGHQLRVPRGVFHPLRDGSTAFLMRTVGPMVAADQRVLDLGTGSGIGAVVAASRGAAVVACDESRSAVAAAEANLRAAGLGDRVDLRPGRFQDVLGDERFDLVWFNGPQGPSGYRLMGDVLDACPSWLEETGRLVVAVDRTAGMGEFVRSRVPRGYRVVQLARSLELLGSWEALCIGWDVEAARARRHSGRSAEAKAEVSRKRWRRVNEPPVDEASG